MSEFVKVSYSKSYSSASEFRIEISRLLPLVNKIMRIKVIFAKHLIAFANYKFYYTNEIL